MKVFTTFLFKLFYDQLRNLLALRVLVLVVGGFFERVFSHLRLFIPIRFVYALLVFLGLSSKFLGVAKAHAQRYDTQLAL